MKQLDQLDLKIFKGNQKSMILQFVQFINKPRKIEVMQREFFEPDSQINPSTFYQVIFGYASAFIVMFAAYPCQYYLKKHNKKQKNKKYGFAMMTLALGLYSFGSYNLLKAYDQLDESKIQKIYQQLYQQDQKLRKNIKKYSGLGRVKDQ